jgi:hypothetical protein
VTGIVALVVAAIAGSVIFWALHDDAKSDDAASALKASTVAGASVRPRANVDHWHAAFGVWKCDKWMPDLAPYDSDAVGIHHHGDGLIHIHPFTETAAGRNANLATFASNVGLTLDATSLTTPDGWKVDASAGCGGSPARLALEVWSANAVATNSAPVVVSKPDDVVFDEDKMAVVVAVLPTGAPLTQLPPSLPRLSDPLNAEGAPTPTLTAPPTVTMPPPRTSESTGAHPYTVPKGTRENTYPAMKGLQATPVRVAMGDFGGLLVGRPLHTQIPSDELLLGDGTVRTKSGQCDVWGTQVGQGSLTIFTRPGAGSRDMIVSIGSLDEGAWWRTTHGIQAGSTLDELRHAYGSSLKKAPASAIPPDAHVELWHVDEGSEILGFTVTDGKVNSVTTGYRTGSGDECA